MTDLPPPFWCWTEGEPSTFRCRERGHDVRETAPIGVLPRSAWTDSQQDLIHIESQLRDAEKELYATQRLVDQKQEELGRYSDLLTAARAKQEQGERDRIELKNENSLLLAKLDRQRVDADLARRTLGRVSDWHSPSAHRDEAGLCGGCGGHWPCQTRQILDGREPVSWDGMSETYPGSGVYE